MADPLGLFTIPNALVSISIISGISGLINAVTSKVTGGTLIGGFIGGFIATFASLAISFYFPSTIPYSFGFGSALGTFFQKLYENWREVFSARSIASYVLSFLVGLGLGALGGHGSFDLVERLTKTITEKGLSINVSWDGIRGAAVAFFNFLRSTPVRDLFKVIGDFLRNVKTIIEDIIYYHSEAIKEFGLEIAKGNYSTVASSLFLVPLAEKMVDGMFALGNKIQDIFGTPRRTIPGLE